MISGIKIRPLHSITFNHIHHQLWIYYIGRDFKKNMTKVSRDIFDESKSKVLSLVASDTTLGELLGEVSGRGFILSLVHNFLLSAVSAGTEVQHLL